jgi:FAD/FMN-containing dehydrogenase
VNTDSQPLTLAPSGLDDLRRSLAVAHAQRRRVASVELSSINRLVEHTAEDLTATVEAGMTLAEFQSRLATRQQWLPLDPPHAHTTTLGEILSQNLSGPRRFGFGTIRERLLGVAVVRADGRLIRGGGKVVKNVAGYDLCKLFVGSRGSLGVIVEATFKLNPLPESEKFVQARAADATELAALLRAVNESGVAPVVLDAHNLDTAAPANELRAANHFTVVVGFSGASEDVAAQCETLARLGLRETTTLDYENIFWSSNTADVKRWSVLPSRLAECAARLGGAPFVARAGNGLICYRGGPDAPRASLPIELMRRLKNEFDPASIFPDFQT